LGIYTGYCEKTPNEDELSYFYSHLNENVYECLTNEYVILHLPDGVSEDFYRWNGNEYKPLVFNPLKSKALGVVKPRNLQQKLAFDLLQNEKITVKALTGCFGSGKTMLMIATALQDIEAKKFEKIVWVRNNIDVKNTKPIGALPDGLYNKLLPFALPIADHLGGIDGLDTMVRQGLIEIQHLGFMRGRDIRNAIIMSSEAENLTREHAQLLIGRVGEGSQLWLDGDLRQTDMQVFDDDNGLKATLEKLKGNPLFGCVNMPKSERSTTAALADLLD